MDLQKHEVTWEKLRWHCPPEDLPFECTDELVPLQEFIGQDRALRSLEFGLGVDRSGYNLFLTGLTGTGKASAIQSHLQKLITQRQREGYSYTLYDWCYVHNFTDPDRSRVLKLPQGKGKVLKQQMEDLVKRLKEEVPRAFSGEDYESQRKEIVERGQARHQSLLQELDMEARREGFTVQLSPMGAMLFPTSDGRPMTREEYAALEEEKRQKLEARRAELLKRVETAFELAHAAQKATEDKVKELDRKVGGFAIGAPFALLLKEFRDFPEVCQFLEEARTYTLDNLELFREPEAAAAAAQTQAPWLAMRQRDPFLAYAINVFVDNSQAQGPPIVIEPNPNWGNIFGKIERHAFMGAYFSDHTLLKPGAVQLANGGYLVLNIRDVLMNPGVWEGLKRLIRTKEARLEDPLEQFGFLAPMGLRPQPVPIELKVVITGDELFYRLLSLYDEDFWEMFKVKADFDYQIARNRENLAAYGAFVCGCCQAEKLLPFEQGAVARVAEQGARMVADQEKLSSRFGQIKDLLIEADYWARKDGKPRVMGEHVHKAIEEKIYRLNLMAERVRRLIAEGTLMVDVDGAVVGQVNGLSVYDLGDFSFGRPSRITARTFSGRAGVLNIERESQLSGRIHDKGVLILSGHLGWRYAQDKPLSLSASLCFEQSYEGVEGDSASSAELYALLSSLADLPISQSLAVTGSVNQKGEVQPIGGANQKIEGFYDVCQAKGLTGRQGVLIPHQNLRNLMLREDVVAAVKKGKFHIYAVKTVDEGMEILTGVAAGEKGADGNYPEGTINHRVDQRLRELAKTLRGYAPPSEAVPGPEKPEK